MATTPRDAFEEGTRPAKEQPSGGNAGWPYDGSNLHPEAQPGATKAGDAFGPGTFGRERTPRRPTFADGVRSGRRR
jgi:hypothetical protein